MMVAERADTRILDDRRAALILSELLLAGIAPAEALVGVHFTLEDEDRDHAR